MKILMLLQKNWFEIVRKVHLANGLAYQPVCFVKIEKGKGVKL